MAEFPSLPLFTDAYLADTLDLDLEQHGAYLLLLAISWRRPRCSLPADFDGIKRLLGGACRGVHGNRFNRIVPPLLDRFFDLVDDGFGPEFVQKRLRKEREFVRKHAENMRDLANKRWSAINNNNDLHDAHAMRSRNAPTPTPIEDKKKESKKEKAQAPQKPAPFSLPEWVPQEPWLAFVEMRRKIRKPPTDHACELIVAELSKLRHKGHDPTTVLNQSTRNSWQDVYPPKINGSSQRKNPMDAQLAGALMALEEHENGNGHPSAPQQNGAAPEAQPPLLQARTDGRPAKTTLGRLP